MHVWYPKIITKFPSEYWMKAYSVSPSDLLLST